jgi:hypothetical protein
LRNDDDNTTGDALRSGCPVWHAPGELAKDSASMSLGTSLLRGSHFGRHRSGDNGGGGRFAMHDDDDNATGDALRSGRPVWHAPGELARDSGSMPLGTSMLRGSHCGSNRTCDDCGVGGRGCDRHQRSWMTQQLLSAPLRTSPPFISKQKELGGYNATGDSLRLGRPVQHAPGELARDSGSMPLGTSLPQGSHVGSNRTGEDGGC